MSQQYAPEQIDHILSKVSINLNTTNLSVRACNCLRADQIYFVGSLLCYTEMELRKIPNFGRISLNEVREFLEREGLKIGQFVAFRHQILKDFSPTNS